MCEQQLKNEKCEIKDKKLEWVFTKMLQPQLYILMALNRWSRSGLNLSQALFTSIKVYTE